MPGKCKYNADWCNNDDINSIKKWLRPCKSDIYKALCVVCNSEFDVSNSGISSVRKHANGKSHVKNITSHNEQHPINFQKVSSDQICSTKPAVVSSNVEIINLVDEKDKTTKSTKSTCNLYNKEDVTKAEILWALNKVLCHFSLRDRERSSNIFSSMFPDSLIAEKFSMRKDKLAYVLTYGLGPHFQSQLTDLVRKCTYFAISFDESLNKVAQRGQMDIHVRYWDNGINAAVTRYLTSTFLTRARADDLLESFTSAIANLNLSNAKIIQISMDGPHVNFSFLRSFKDFIKDEPTNSNQSTIIDIGSCSLHLIHGCYKTAHAKTEWNLNNFLRAIYYLFKDFPSRRADFIHYSQSDKFPLKFCAIRWVENSNVIERAIKILPNIKKYIEGTEKKPPQTKNYAVVKQFLNDKFLEPKLLFMQSVALELEPFLKMFQSNKPLLPLMYNELYTVMASVLGRFIKSEKIEKVKNAAQLMDIDVTDTSNQRTAKTINIGFGASSACKNFKEVEVLQFKNECKNFLVALSVKMIEKSPLKKKFVKGVSCLSPSVMLSSTLRESRITLVLEQLCLYNQINHTDAEKIKCNYIEVCNNLTVQSKLKNFNKKSHSLDTFIFNELELDYDSNVEFFNFCKRIFVLFHGNAAVEGGFSINADCLVEHLEEDSLISQRSIHSAVLAAGGNILNIEITKSMLVSFRSASSRRDLALKEKKKNKEEETDNIKSASIQIAALKEKRKMLSETVELESNEIDNQIKQLTKKLKK